MYGFIIRLRLFFSSPVQSLKTVWISDIDNCFILYADLIYASFNDVNSYSDKKIITLYSKEGT